MTPAGLRPSSRRAALLALTGALLAIALPVGGAPASAAGRSADTVPSVGTVPGIDPAVIDVTPPAVQQYYAGGAVESIAPTPEMIATGEFYLGGFGFSSGDTLVDPLDPYTKPAFARAATGVLPGEYAPSVRAMALGDGKNAIVTAQIETQGYFLAYKNGDYGIVDIRREAAAQIAQLAAAHPGVNALPARAIVIDSNHTHGGPDTAGVWGGVPTEPKYHGDMDYLLLVKNRTVKAIVDAWKSLQPVDLVYGVKAAGVEGAAYDSRYPAGFDRLQTNQYADDPANQIVDDEVRVLRATKPITGEPVLTYVNFSAHADVLGGGNTLTTGDYTGPLSEQVADGGIGLAQVATLGREQPSRGSCPTPMNGELQQVACLRGYATRVARRVDEALADAQPVRGPKVVAMSSQFLTDAATNTLLVAAGYGGFAAGLPVLRATAPPWQTGNVMGTTMFTGRIGDIVINGIPGEAYPQILQRVRDELPGKQGYISIGTAGDFLGYIIYPFGAYPEPIRHSILGGDPPPAEATTICEEDNTGVPYPGPAGCIDPIGNDNFFFNLSETFGQRLVCSELRGANVNFPDANIDVVGVEPACAAFTADAAVPAGWETQFSSTSVGASPTPDVPEAPYTVLFLLVALGAGGVVIVRRRAA